MSGAEDFRRDGEGEPRRRVFCRAIRTAHEED
jgi:hypothetical protein